MRKLLTIALALLATLVVVAAAAADTKPVQITRSGFTPTTSSVQLGDTVAWHNADTADHQDDAEFADRMSEAENGAGQKTGPGERYGNGPEDPRG